MTGKNRGLSLFEMLVVVTIVGVLSISMVPVAELTYIRTQEQLLEENLELIRSAIQDWKNDCRIAVTRQMQNTTDGMLMLLELPDGLLHPPSLAALVNPPAAGHQIEWSYGDPPALIPAPLTFYPRKYLQNIPADPFVGRPAWQLHYTDGSDNVFDGSDPSAGTDRLFDVSPIADPATRRYFEQAIDGTEYKDW